MIKSLKIVILILGIACLGVLFYIPLASGASSLTRKIYTDRDSYINVYSGSTNYGNEDSLWISDITYRAFIHFDLSKKPLEIIKAEIVLNFFYVSGSTTITIYKAKSDDWQESTITWNNAPSYNTIVCTGTIYGNARFSIELPDTSYEWNQVTLVVKSSDDQGFDTITSKDNTYSTSLDDVPHIMYTYTPPGIPSYNPFIIIGIISICTLFLIKGVSKKFVSVGKI